MTALATLPDNLPSVARARLPELYESARGALAECERIDECKDWTDKMEAMASYAKQAKDETLRRCCDRIQARAIRRCGELMKQIPAESSGQKVGRGGAPPSKSPRIQAARGAGLSRDQQRTAIRVANVPEDEFEEAVEAEEPATVTELAERGKRQSTAHLKGRDPADFAMSTRGQGALRRFVVEVGPIDASAVVRGASAGELRKMVENIDAAKSWLADLSAALKKKT